VVRAACRTGSLVLTGGVSQLDTWDPKPERAEVFNLPNFTNFTTISK
jgi:hypothetical protein